MASRSVLTMRSSRALRTSGRRAVRSPMTSPAVSRRTRARRISSPQKSLPDGGATRSSTSRARRAPFALFFRSRMPTARSRSMARRRTSGKPRLAVPSSTPRFSTARNTMRASCRLTLAARRSGRRSATTNSRAKYFLRKAARYAAAMTRRLSQSKHISGRASTMPTRRTMSSGASTSSAMSRLTVRRLSR